MAQDECGPVKPLVFSLLALAVEIVPPAPGTTASPPSETAQAGGAAPGFELISVDGRRVRLSDFRGKVVLLNFWATWCVPCRVEMPQLVELYGRHRSRGLEVVGVSMDDAGARGVARFLRENPVTYPILLDGKSIADAYGGVRLLPQTFLIDRAGRVADRVTGVERKGALETRVERLLRTPSRRPS